MLKRRVALNGYSNLISMLCDEEKCVSVVELRGGVILVGTVKRGISVSDFAEMSVVRANVISEIYAARVRLDECQER